LDEPAIKEGPPPATNEALGQRHIKTKKARAFAGLTFSTLLEKILPQATHLITSTIAAIFPRYAH
jgi:hypothetical protein